MSYKVTLSPIASDRIKKFRAWNESAGNELLDGLDRLASDPASHGRPARHVHKGRMQYQIRISRPPYTVLVTVMYVCAGDQVDVLDVGMLDPTGKLLDIKTPNAPKK